MINPQAIILAGGRGSRLSNIINDRPKPMADVNGYPFLEYLIHQLKSYGLTEIILSVGYKGEIIKDYFGDGSKWSVDISYSEEEIPLGTGGAILKAKSLIKTDNFIVMNGDSLLELDYHVFIKSHYSHKGIGTIAIAGVEDASRYGSVKMDEQHRIVSFNEKGIEGKGYINGGIYCFNKDIFHHIPEGYVSIEKEIFPKLINNGLYGFKTEGFFIDIGTPESYELAQKEMSKVKM